MKELKFIHITKCAGTSIEDIGKQNNIEWGRYHEKEYGFWHELFPNKSTELKQKYDWFMVVRNPYDRLISEFYCKWSYGVGHLPPHIIDKIDIKQFNEFIRHQILNRYKTGYHYIEQYKYLDNTTHINIIYFENINIEFNKLMKKYKLDLVMNMHKNKPTCKKKFSRDSFSPELLNLINDVYDKDFTTFGFDKIIP